MQPDQSFEDIRSVGRLFVDHNSQLEAGSRTDEHGFLTPSQKFFSYERLVKYSCSLVTAPPWVGKSFTAKSIKANLDQGFDPKTSEPPTLLDLEEWSDVGLQLPSWWEEWKSSKKQAYWLIDALEEGQRRKPGICKKLVRVLKELPDDNRERLHLVLFARLTDLREVAEELEDQLVKIYGADFLHAELLRLHRDSAEKLIAEESSDDGAFARVLEIIDRNALQPVAGYPAVLKYLVSRSATTTLSRADVWGAILEELLRERRGERDLAFKTELEHRFAAAERMAVAFTLGGVEEFGESTSNLPKWLDVIPPSGPKFVETSRDAAREALITGMFRATGRGFRFIHRNVREWMAAFGLSKWRLEKLRPVLRGVENTKAPGDFLLPEFTDLGRLLLELQTGDSPEVAEWLSQALDSQPSDLFVRDLSHIRELLDRLEELASRGGRPDWLENEDTVQQLGVQGLDEELALRLSDQEKPTDARRLILRIGTVLEMQEVMQIAAQIVRDDSEDPSFRSSCAAAVSTSGSLELLRSLEDFVRSSEATTSIEKRTISALICSFVENDLWSTATAFEFMPRGPTDEIIDHTTLLPHVLEDHMTEDDAKEIFQNLSGQDVDELNISAQSSCEEGQRDLEPRWHVLASAAKKLAMSGDEEDLCLSNMLRFTASIGYCVANAEHQLVNTLRQQYVQSKEARRELFLAVVDKQGDPGGNHIESRNWLVLTSALTTRHVVNFIYGRKKAFPRGSRRDPDPCGAACRSG